MTFRFLIFGMCAATLFGQTTAAPQPRMKLSISPTTGYASLALPEPENRDTVVMDELKVSAARTVEDTIPELVRNKIDNQRLGKQVWSNRIYRLPIAIGVFRTRDVLGEDSKYRQPSPNVYFEFLHISLPTRESK